MDTNGLNQAKYDGGEPGRGANLPGGVFVCVWMGVWSVSVFLTALPWVVDPAECLGVDGCMECFCVSDAFFVC